MLMSSALSRPLPVRRESVFAGAQAEEVDLSVRVSRDDVPAVRRTVCTPELPREAGKHILGAGGPHLQEEITTSGGERTSRPD